MEKGKMAISRASMCNITMYLPRVYEQFRIIFYLYKVYWFKPIQSTECSIGQRNDLLSKYKSFTHTWLLANFMTIESSILKDDCGGDESVQLINVEDNDSVTSTFHSKIPLEVTEREQRNVTCLYGQDKAKQILQVINIHTRRKKVDKKDVMPTWASTQSLLLSNKEQVGEKCVNTAAIAPFSEHPLRTWLHCTLF